LIRAINPVLRGWGSYFRTGNAADKFVQVDDYVVERLRGLMIKRKGRHLVAGQAARWNRPYFEAFGLHRLRGTVQYPEAA
jgi:RNA-directed DNA polymerase